MFWIPIAAIAFVIWYIGYISNTVKTAKYDREYDQWRKSVDTFQELTRDRDLEQKLRWDFEDNKIDCNAVVREFMGGDPKWADYAGGNAYGRRKAEIILMAQQGKFPGPMSSFSLDSANPKTRFTQTQWTDMNAEFLMKLQALLRQRLGRNVVLYASYYEHDSGDHNLINRTLRDCIARGESKYLTWAANLTFVIE